MRGQLSAREDLWIEGQFDGEIQAPDQESTDFAQKEDHNRVNGPVTNFVFEKLGLVEPVLTGRHFVYLHRRGISARRPNMCVVLTKR